MPGQNEKNKETKEKIVQEKFFYSCEENFFIDEKKLFYSRKEIFVYKSVPKSSLYLWENFFYKKVPKRS